MVRALRGATRVEADVPQEIWDRTAELVAAMIEANGLDHDQLISMIFTATPDLHSAFPAAAARAMGMTDVPLFCAAEIDVPGSMPKVIRVLMHVESDVPRARIAHVYLHGTDALRDDLPSLS